MSITEINSGSEIQGGAGPLIRLGEISYINCEIFNLPLLKLISAHGFENIEVIKGVPSHLNQLFKDELIDVAPISSFAYLKMKRNCKLIKRVSISSFGEVKSVLFFSDLEMSSLKRQQQETSLVKIYISEESASSVALLKILLAEKYALDLEKIEFIKFSGAGAALPNKLLIGDLALQEKLRCEALGEGLKPVVLDLGEEWFEFSNGLPMVFGVWAHRLNTNTEKIMQDLIITAKTMGLNQDFDEIVSKVELETGLGKRTLVDYYQSLNYDFTEEHICGLALYEQYLRNLGLLLD